MPLKSTTISVPEFPQPAVPVQDPSPRQATLSSARATHRPPRHHLPCPRAGSTVSFAPFFTACRRRSSSADPFPTVSRRRRPGSCHRAPSTWFQPSWPRTPPSSSRSRPGHVAAVLASCPKFLPSALANVTAVLSDLSGCPSSVTSCRLRLLRSYSSSTSRKGHRMKVEGNEASFVSAALWSVRGTGGRPNRMQWRHVVSRVWPRAASASKWSLRIVQIEHFPAKAADTKFAQPSAQQVSLDAFYQVCRARKSRAIS